MEEAAAHNGSAAGAGAGAGSPAAARPPATPEGMALAYGSLVLMALLPIFFGALRSVSCAKSKNSSEMPETITSRDAARFPIVASCTLLGLYLFFKIFSQEYINLLLSMYFFVLGILALSHTISPMMNRFFPANFPNKQYQLLFTQGSGESKEEIVNYEFDTKDLVCLALSSVVGVWYLLRKHWIANNLFGLAFSLNGVELLHLNNVSTGCILLGGLFIYDVFWVNGSVPRGGRELQPLAEGIPGLAGISSGLLWGTRVCGVSSSGDLCSQLRSSQCLTELLDGLEDKAALGYADPACTGCPSALVICWLR
ncbi:minor histocompatibility antigen H13 isoform 3-T3 [Spheniscus humboldti]